jgi:hypothetical protein
VLDLYCSHEVLNEFPNIFLSSSQCVPNISSSLYPISFALSFGLVTFITNPKEEIPTHLFWLTPKLDYYFLVMGQSKMPITKEKKIEL